MTKNILVEMVSRFGLPTALAVILALLLVRQMDMLSDQVEFIARLVDAVCPGVPRGR